MTNNSELTRQVRKISKLLSHELTKKRKKYRVQWLNINIINLTCFKLIFSLLTSQCPALYDAHSARTRLVRSTNVAGNSQIKLPRGPPPLPAEWTANVFNVFGVFFAAKGGVLSELPKWIFRGIANFAGRPPRSSRANRSVI